MRRHEAGAYPDALRARRDWGGRSVGRAGAGEVELGEEGQKTDTENLLAICAEFLREHSFFQALRESRPTRQDSAEGAKP